jgi:pimeloyl-ACP methyl ester carboxylesterase
MGSKALITSAGWQENVDDIKLMVEDEAAARSKSRQDRDRLMSLDAEGMVGAFPTLLSAVDAAAFSPDLGQYLWSSGHDGLAPGDEGWWEDSWALVQPWGFDLGAIQVPVQLWHGRHDQFVPFQHGQWLAARIPGVDAHLTDQDGHITLLQNRVAQVHAWLLEHF